AAVGMPDPEQGEIVMAYVVKTEDALTEEEVIAYCREHLAKYKVPRRVAFLEELPKNATGKILRRELQKLS
ncbi:MAG TPA: long-chain fatty acid--CoA ligase, partial [Candidatus Kurthia intestinigallinarum]|nr:long-chain fatty acid--CoA ligase [Candidatus Kurthia intestinigallinarum]